MSFDEDQFLITLGSLDRNVPPGKVSLVRLHLTASGAPNDEDVQRAECVSQLYNAIKTAFPGYDAITFLQYALQEAESDVTVLDYHQEFKYDEDSLKACHDKGKLAKLLVHFSKQLSSNQFAKLRELARERIDTHPDYVSTPEKFFRVCVYLRIFEEKETLEEFRAWLKAVGRKDLAKELRNCIRELKDRDMFPSAMSETQRESASGSDPRDALVTGAGNHNQPLSAVQECIATRDGDRLIFYRHEATPDREVESGPQQEPIHAATEYVIRIIPRTDRSSCLNTRTCALGILISFCIIGFSIFGFSVAPAGFTLYVAQNGQVNKTTQNYLFYTGEVRVLGETGLLVNGQTIKRDTSTTTDQVRLEYKYVKPQTFESLKEAKHFQCPVENHNVTDFTCFSIPFRDCRIPFGFIGSSISVSMFLKGNDTFAKKGSLYIFDDSSKRSEFLHNNCMTQAANPIQLDIGIDKPVANHILNISFLHEGHYFLAMNLPLGVQIISLNVSADLKYINTTWSRLTDTITCTLNDQNIGCSPEVGTSTSTNLLLARYDEPPAGDDAIVTVNDTSRFNLGMMKTSGIALSVVFSVFLILSSIATVVCCVFFLPRRMRTIKNP